MYSTVEVNKIFRSYPLGGLCVGWVGYGAGPGPPPSFCLEEIKTLLMVDSIDKKY